MEMAQILAKHDVLSERAEEHERIVMEAIADGVITPGERAMIAWSIRRVKRAAGLQGRRISLVVRMIRGGSLDREIMQDVKDYNDLVREEKAAEQWRPLAA